MYPEANCITDEFLERLPEFFLRAALRHMLTYSFPRSLNKKMPLKMKEKGKYLLPEDSKVRERKLEPPVDVQGLLAGDADHTVPCPRRPAGGWRHASVPPTFKDILRVKIEGLDGEAADVRIMRPPKRRRVQRGSSV